MRQSSAILVRLLLEVCYCAVELFLRADLNLNTSIRGFETAESIKIRLVLAAESTSAFKRAVVARIKDHLRCWNLHKSRRPILAWVAHTEGRVNLIQAANFRFEAKELAQSK